MDAKKGVLAVVVLFIGFYMFKDPAASPSWPAPVPVSWGLTTQLFEATIRFLNELF